MENFVLLYHFEDQNSEKYFEKEINQRFERHHTEENGQLRYFGFAERAEPAVVDKLNTVLNRVGIGTKDYVALYHAGKNDPDRIQRQMLIGHDRLVETKVEKVSFDAHRGNLTRLLNFNYLKEHQQQEQEKQSKK